VSFILGRAHECKTKAVTSPRWRLFANQLREMVEAGKTITMISLTLKRTVTAVRGRLGILKVSLGRVGRHPKRATEAGGLPEMKCAHVPKKKND
jgi:hypothetical protein